MSIDPTRHFLGGLTMGTRWSAEIYAVNCNLNGLQTALQTVISDVDAQMSTWRAESDLMRLNDAPLDAWVTLPSQLINVLDVALQIGRSSQGAFEIAIGDAIAAWGFGEAPADVAAIHSARIKPRRPSFETLELDVKNNQARKHEAQTYDLSGIAKGFGVDRLAEVLHDFGIASGIVTIDGELRAIGGRGDGSDWPIIIERPDRDQRAPHSLLTLRDAAVATSGDYRHWVNASGRTLSHTIDPRTGVPLLASPASVTVIAPTCMHADAFATALMVLGEDQGSSFAEHQKINALFLIRNGEMFHERTVGTVFAS